MPKSYPTPVPKNSVGHKVWVVIVGTSDVFPVVFRNRKKAEMLHREQPGSTFFEAEVIR